ncbi:MAG: tail fiber protein [bacterium]|nr:tail fiber protein [bacterium]
MNKFFNISFSCLLLSAVLAFSGCESGLKSESDSSKQGDDREFSFSEMYNNINDLKSSQATLNSTDAGLQAQIDALSSGLVSRVAELESEVASLKEVSAPVGSIQAWDKNLAGTPEIPAGWVECDGQVVSDAGSVYDGLAVPDLNSGGRFLRGGAVSGNWQDDATAVNGLGIGSEGAHSHTSQTRIWHRCNTDALDNNYCPNIKITGSYRGDLYYFPNEMSYGGYTDFNITTSSAGSHSHSLTGDTETRPTNMSVVWIMRIK